MDLTVVFPEALVVEFDMQPEEENRRSSSSRVKSTRSGLNIKMEATHRVEEAWSKRPQREEQEVPGQVLSHRYKSSTSLSKRSGVDSDSDDSLKDVELVKSRRWSQSEIDFNEVANPRPHIECRNIFGCLGYGNKQSDLLDSEGIELERPGSTESWTSNLPENDSDHFQEECVVGCVPGGYLEQSSAPINNHQTELPRFDNSGAKARHCCY